jgi:DNA topoisomerase IB
VSVPEIVPNSVESTKAVGLRHVSDEMPGIRRVKAGKSFRYEGPNGAAVSDEDQRRIKSLVIPPAWTDVWICPLAHGHIQVTGHDVRGRKQYRYHPRWREVRDETKYNRMIEFGRTLPKIRARIRKDMALPGLPKAKVLATVVRLLEVSLIRVGNDEYARDNKSFGLTTLRDQHVHVSGSTVRFRFRGKSGKQHIGTGTGQLPGQGEEEHRPRGRSGGADAGQHALDLPQMLRASGRPPGLFGRSLAQHLALPGRGEARIVSHAAASGRSRRPRFPGTLPRG